MLKIIKSFYIIFLIIILIISSFNLTVLSDNIEKNTFLSNNKVNMVIITPEIFAPELDSLIEHKTSFGINTTIKTTENIYIEYKGRDNIEKIKYFIKDAIENHNISYVLIIGDIDKVPIRTTGLSWDYFGNIAVENVITDLYYADIYNSDGTFSNWDTNNDGIYSEIRMITNGMEDNETFQFIDNIDGIPDVGIGRIPCNSKFDIQNAIKKIISYETNTYNEDWFKRIILMGGDTFPYIGNMSEGEFVGDYISTVMSDFNPIKLYASYNNFKPMKINNEISKGAGFVCYSGHGFQYGFGTSDYNQEKLIKYYTPFIFGLKNYEKLPIFYLDACWTGALDFSIGQIKIPSLAWSLIKKPNGGAIACIASTRVGYGGFEGNPMGAGSPCMNACFFESYEPGIYLSDIFVNAQKKYIDKVWNNVFTDCLTLQEFILLGDPTLKVGGYNL